MNTVYLYIILSRIEQFFKAENNCGIAETPETEEGVCPGLEDCCKFDEWTEWSQCELSDGRLCHGINI